MRRIAAAATLVLILVASCAGPSVAGVTGASPESVAVQQGDVPAGLQRCSESGEINGYLNSVKSKNPSTYKQVNDQWQKEKQAGGTAGAVEVYADSKDECDSLANGTSPSSSAPPKIVLNYVVQFKDDASAAKDYNDEVLGLNPSDIQKQGGTVLKGTGTGLGSNSSAGSISLFGLQLEFAVWQKKTFFTAVIAVGLTDTDAKKIYTAVNGRIH
jgi:hypothetical protein